jgi:hypothetical protein
VPARSTADVRRFFLKGSTGEFPLTTIDRKFFFDQCRQTLFTGKLSQGQVDGLSFILNIWEAGHADKDDRWLVYALGTAFHETQFTMQAVRELGRWDCFFAWMTLEVRCQIALPWPDPWVRRW